MRYMLHDYSETTFRSIDDLVRLCFRNEFGARTLPFRGLSQIGNTYEGLSPANIDYIDRENSLNQPLNGVCFHSGKQPELFTIWMSPNLEPYSMTFEFVLIHELCHGYLGPTVLHGKQWRQYFGRTLLLYSKLINTLAEPDIDWQLKHIVRRYRTEDNLNEDFSSHVEMCNRELKWMYGFIEKYGNIITSEFHQLQEMRKCQKFLSNSTPTPAYLASLRKKAGMASPLI